MNFLFFSFCIFLSQQEEQGSKLIGLVKELKTIFLHTSSVIQGQSVCLIGAFTSEILSLGLNSVGVQQKLPLFLYLCSAFLTVVLVHDQV